MSDRNAAAIEREIEKERSALAEAIADLQGQISPARLTGALSENLREVAGKAVDSLAGTVRRHPVPAALAGLGLAWLAASAARGAGAGDRAQRDADPDPKAMPADAPAGPPPADGAPRDAAESPLLLAGLAFVAGAAAGALLPATRREEVSVGARRDRIFEEAERICREERARLGRIAEAAIREGRVLGEAVAKARATAPDPGAAAGGLAQFGARLARRMADTARDAAPKGPASDA